MFAMDCMVRVRNCCLSGKSLKTVMPTVDYHAFVNFLAVYDTKHLKFRVQKFESHSLFRVEAYIV